MIEIPKGVRGLIFDCDGTVADTMRLHYLSWQEALKPYKCPFPEPLFYELGGIPTSGIVKILSAKYGVQLPEDTVVNHKETAFEKLIPSAKAIAPVACVIRENHGKLPMAVATGSTRSICKRILTEVGLDDYFEALVTADDVQRGKPAPDIFQEAARRLGIAPEKCLAFEDADLGILAAREAGMTVIDVRPYTGEYCSLKK